jgi:ppGpp synthetase/RelA/SpoT-type nucleotidyltranferase
MILSNSQIDKIGGRLRFDDIDADCLRKLEIFRELYVDAYRYVEDILENKVGVPITGRPSKSTVAIVEKLKRETIRLNQIQDISGCRVLVNGLAEQDDLVESLLVLFPYVEVDDKRRVPTNGYRAVHVIVYKDGRPVEIQVRTRLQHAWAEISEKIADEHGHEIKYGKGDEGARSFLDKLSAATEELEQIRHHHRVLLSRKRMQGKSQTLVRQIKKINVEERSCIKRIRQIFSGKG